MRIIPTLVHRHLTTIVVAAAVAAVTAGGPAVAATVVAYAKNAGAVDGRSAVPANATVAQRKGRLVATGKNGLLPNDIIAQAPDSARLGGIALGGLSAHYLTAHGNWVPTVAGGAFCATTVITPTANSIAVVNVTADARGALATLFALQAAISSDGGTTFTRTVPNWYVGATSPANAYSSVSNSANVSLRKGRHYAFAGYGYAQAAMSSGDCTVTVTVYPNLPGTTLTAPLTSSASTPARRSPSGVNAAR